MRSKHRRQLWRMSVACALMLQILAGCVQKMADQPREDTFETSTFFADGMGARQPVAGTVARGSLEDEVVLTGRRDGQTVREFPLELNEEVLSRGRNRFEIFCTPCHGRVGDGRGMVVKRGFPAPPTYHSERLREAPIGHLFDVVSNGLGRMPRFSDRISPNDRWAIAAYVRALQLSQHAELQDLPPEDRTRIQEVAR